MTQQFDFSWLSRSLAIAVFAVGLMTVGCSSTPEEAAPAVDTAKTDAEAKPEPTLEAAPKNDAKGEAKATAPKEAPKEKKAAAGGKRIKKGGMEYVVSKAGRSNGKVAKANQPVSVHYDGKLENGTMFDSSRKRGEPFTFILGAKQVIPGWDVGVEGMKEGEKRTLYIPPAMAYGDRGVPGAIPPKSKLIFDVELLEVKSN